MKNKYAYCLTHDSPLIADLPIPMRNCVVIYAPIPELSPAWYEFEVEPDAEEMAQMDESAEALWFDLQGDL